MHQDDTIGEGDCFWGCCKGGLSKVKVLEPKCFNGMRDDKEVENFLWNIELYFKALNIQDESAKVHTILLHLTVDAIPWWRLWCIGIENGLCTIDTYETIKKEIKFQFYSENIKFLARKSLRQLKYIGSVKNYVKEFTGSCSTSLTWPRRTYSSSSSTGYSHGLLKSCRDEESKTWILSWPLCRS